MKEVKTVRVKFAKRGRLIYISHLDLNRVFARAFKRAGLPMFYSEGFTPHPRFGFALPLSVGISSECEFVDIKLAEDMSCEEVGRRLCAALPGELEVLEAYESEARFKTITDSDYEITLISEKITADTADTAKRLLSAQPLVVLKKTKSGEKDVDISRYIRRADISGETGKLSVKCILCADSANYLNPEYLVKILDGGLGLDLAEDINSIVEIKRTEVYINGEKFR